MLITRIGTDTKKKVLRELKKRGEMITNEQKKRNEEYLKKKKKME